MDTQDTTQTRALAPLTSTRRLANILNAGYASAAGLIGDQIRNHKRAVELIKKATLRHPNNPAMPYIAMVSFSFGRAPRSVRQHLLMHALDNNGQQKFNDKNAPQMELTEDKTRGIVGKVMLPRGKNQELISSNVFLARTLAGDGGMIDALDYDAEAGIYRPGKPLACFFFRPIKNGKIQDKGLHFAMPLGLAASEEDLEKWNLTVQEKQALGQTGNWFPIAKVENRLKTGNPYLTLQPRGLKANGGLIAVYKTSNRKEAERRIREGLKTGDIEGDQQMLEYIGGKLAILAKKSNPIPWERDSKGRWKTREVRFGFIERLWHIVAWAENFADKAEVSDRVLSATAMQALPEPLRLIGGNLLQTSPDEVPTLMRKALGSPPVELMRQEPWQLNVNDKKEARKTLGGLSRELTQGAVAELEQALKDLIYALGAAGPESSGLPSLEEICNGEPLENIYNLEGVDTNHPMVVSILASSAAEKLKLGDEWKPSSWLLTQVFRHLLMERVKAEGIDFQPPNPDKGKDGEEKKPQGGGIRVERKRRRRKSESEQPEPSDQEANGDNGDDKDNSDGQAA